MRERGRLESRPSLPRVAEKDLAQVEAKQRFQNRSALVDRARENRITPVKALTHARILRALARKQKGELRRGCGRRFGFAGAAEFLDQAAPVLDDGGEPLGETAPAGLQGEGDVANALFRVRFDMCREAATGFRQGIVVAGRQDKQMRGLVTEGGSGGGRDRGRFLDDQMDIGSAYARGIDPGDARFGAARPRPQLGIDEERALLKAEFRVWGLEMKRRGQAFMFERKNGFD